MRISRGIYRKLCKRYDEDYQAHCLTFSCFRGQSLLSKDRCIMWFTSALARARTKCGFDLWAYVIMPEHIHLVLMPHQAVAISRILYHVKKPVTTWAVGWLRRNAPQHLHRLEDRQPNGAIAHRFWQRGGGYDRILRSVSDIHEKIQYVHANPVRRELVEEPSKWKWSSFRAWQDGIDDPVPIDRETLPQLSL